MATDEETPGSGTPTRQESPAGVGESPSPPAPAPAPAGVPVRTDSPDDVRDRLTIFVVRALFFLIAGGIGYHCSARFHTDPLASIGFACLLALVAILGEAYFSRAPIRTLSSITFGLIMGLIFSAVLQPVVDLLVQSIAPPAFNPADREKLLQFLRIITTTILCFFGITVLLQTRDKFKFIIPYVEFRRALKGHSRMLVDTSVLIDGRIQGLLATGIFDQRIVVPRFVIRELQSIADSSDRGRRERGRRGMDILDVLRRDHGVEILDQDLPAGEDVDAALLDLAGEGGRLLTTDFNLQKRARLQGVAVINLNELAAAFKPAVVRGEFLRVRLLRPGDEPGQAVGFMNDGTMVVVENATRRVGDEVGVEVTGATQTSAGKLIFARLQRPAVEEDGGPHARPADRRSGRDGPRRSNEDRGQQSRTHQNRAQQDRPEGERRPPEPAPPDAPLTAPGGEKPPARL